MSQLMAAFGEDFVETQVLSEANSVRYWLRAFATHANAVPNESIVSINQKTISQLPIKGINVYKINTNTVEDRKNFELTNNDSTSNNAFVTYMNQQKSGLYLIITGVNYCSSKVVDDWFSSNLSTCWAGADFAINYPNSAYVGLWGASKGKILSENFYANDGVLKEDSRAKLDIIYDTVGDVGYTGIPYRAIEDTNEYQDFTGYEYIRYPQQNISISKLSEYNLSAGTPVRFTCDLYASADLLKAGSTTRMNIRWFQGSNMLSSVSLEVPNNSPDKWVRFERSLIIPNNADGFTAVVSRYPKTTSKAESKIRNVLMVQTSAPEQMQNSPAEFGVNGIRMNKAIDSGTTFIFELPNTQAETNGERVAKEFRETQE